MFTGNYVRVAPLMAVKLCHSSKLLATQHQCGSQVEVVTPEDHMGDVIGDLNSRRGMVSEFLDKPGGLKVIRAEVPLSEMFSYVSTLRGMTKGRAQYTMTFEKYDNVPNQIQEKIVAENKVAA